jgi:hypothetical protein
METGVSKGSSQSGGVFPRTAMNIVYVDESVCHVRGSRFVLVGAFVASPEWFRQLEFEAQRFRGMVNAFRERTRTIHEFHAFHLFHGTRDFTGLDPMQVESALFSLLAVVRISKRPFIYSVVNTESLQAIPELSDVKPIDLAFRNCLLGVEAWVRNTEPNSTQLCVMDDTQNSRLKNQLKASYRLLRPTGTTFSFKRRLASFHDALYFGDSSDSIANP